MSGAVEHAKKLAARGHLLLTASAQNITNASIRARVIAAGCAKLRAALPIEEYTSVLEGTIERPVEKKRGNLLFPVAFLVLILTVPFWAPVIRAWFTPP